MSNEHWGLFFAVVCAIAMAFVSGMAVGTRL
jgi:hypothetical protein